MPMKLIGIEKWILKSWYLEFGGINIMKTNLTKTQLLVQLKILSARIGMMELKRRIGEKVLISELDAEKRKFNKLAREYKKLTLGY